MTTLYTWRIKGSCLLGESKKGPITIGLDGSDVYIHYSRDDCIVVPVDKLEELLHVSKRPVQIILQSLTEGLTNKFGKIGISVDIKAEFVTETILRLTVTSPEFSKLAHSERQSLVWRMAEHSVSSDELFHVAVIYTFSPEELKQNVSSDENI